MLSIDGLATGIDTSSIVESLLSIQQTQIDRFNVRKQDIVSQQTAFKGLEAKLLALQGSIGSLTRISDNAFEQKTITTSDDTALKVAVSDEAVQGTYRIRVDSLARANQIASNAFASDDTEIALGEYEIQIGSEQSTPVTVDRTNNTLQGLMQTINDSDFGVTASIIDDGSAGDSVHLMLTANEPGAANNIALSFTANPESGEAAELTFDLNNPVQAGSDATVYLGSGDGAIKVVSENNQFDNLFAGVTFEALKADPETEIELNVVRDVEAAKTAVDGFVSSYNEVVTFINDQAKFDPETETASVLFGNRSVSSIRNAISQAVTSVVPGLDKSFNRLTTIGVSITGDGTLTTDTGKLDDVLNGQVDGVDLKDVLSLFSTRGSSDRQNVQFVLASDSTKASPLVTVDGESALVPYEVKVLAAAEKAKATGATLNESVTIGEENNSFTIRVDRGKDVTVELEEGEYSREEIAQHLQQLLDNHSDLKGRPVTVAISDDALSFASQVYGKSSEIAIQESSSLATLGLSDVEKAVGKDVLGQFITRDSEGNEIVESASGNGQMLIGRATGDDKPGATEGLQVRVTLTPSQIDENVRAKVTVTKGIASRLGSAIKNMTESRGSLDRIEDEFASRIDSIDASITRMNALFESKQQSLLQEFARLESSVSELQSVGSLLGAQLSSLPSF